MHSTLTNATKILYYLGGGESLKEQVGANTFRSTYGTLSFMIRESLYKGANKVKAGRVPGDDELYFMEILLTREHLAEVLVSETDMTSEQLIDMMRILTSCDPYCIKG